MTAQRTSLSDSTKWEHHLLCCHTLTGVFAPYPDKRLCNTSLLIRVLSSLTSFWGSPRDICSWSSFCSSLRAPMDCWLRAKSDSSFSPASVKYLEKCSQLRLLAGKSSCWAETLTVSTHTIWWFLQTSWIITALLPSGGCPCQLCGDWQQLSWCPSHWSMTWTVWQRRLQILLNRNHKTNSVSGVLSLNPSLKQTHYKKLKLLHETVSTSYWCLYMTYIRKLDH